MNRTGIALPQVSSVTIREASTEDRKMRRERRNHSASFKAKVAVAAARGPSRYFRFYNAERRHRGLFITS